MIRCGQRHRDRAARAHLEALKELAEAVEARMATEAPAAVLRGFRRENHSVLVVDDHEATRYSISRALRASGYRTIEASAGAQALELSPCAAALVLDVQLPDLHGFEAPCACRCRSARPGP
jgi:PleD family two-component response regulator